MCKSLLVMLRQLAEKAGNDALIDPDGVRYVEDDFDFSHLDTTWPLAMSKFDTPAGQRVIAVSYTHLTLPTTPYV